METIANWRLNVFAKLLQRLALSETLSITLFSKSQFQSNHEWLVMNCNAIRQWRLKVKLTRTRIRNGLSTLYNLTHYSYFQENPWIDPDSNEICLAKFQLRCGVMWWRSEVDGLPLTRNKSFVILTYQDIFVSQWSTSSTYYFTYFYTLAMVRGWRDRYV